MYRYSAKQNIKQAIVLVSLIFAIAAVSLVFSRIVPASLVLQLVAIAALTIGIQLTTRYILTGYDYFLSDLTMLHESNVLRIEQTGGKNRKVVASLDLGTFVAFERRESLRIIQKKYGNIHRIFNYSPDLFSKSEYIYIFEFNGDLNMLILECSDEFVRQLKLRVDVDDID